MGQVIVEVSDELECEARKLGRKELSRLFERALRGQKTRKLMFKVADKLLEKSEMTEKRAIKLGRELKKRVAKQHGIA